MTSLSELAFGYLEGTLTSEQQSELRQRLADESDRNTFARECFLDHEIRIAHSHLSTLNVIADTDANTNTLPEVEPSLHSKSLPPRRLQRRVWNVAYEFISNHLALSLLVSAIVMANILLSMAHIVPDWKQFVPGNEPKTPSTEFVAHIARTSGASFDKSSNGNFKNLDLFDDDSIVLKSGLAVIEYGTGARVALEGPATYRVQGANGGDLQFGKLVARVDTPQSQGFAVDIPGGRIVDLGTEFGAVVAVDGAVDVVAITGKIELVGSPQATGAAQSVRLTAGESASVEATSGRIVQHQQTDERLLAGFRRQLRAVASGASANGERGPLSFEFARQISGNTDFSISVFDGKASYVGKDAFARVTGIFGDGTVEGYRFWRNLADHSAIETYAEGGGILSDVTRTSQTSFSDFDRGDVWTTHDPGTGASAGKAANFGGSTFTISGAYEVAGTIDVSTFSSGTVYVLAGGYENPFQVDLTMSGKGLSEVRAGTGSIDPALDRNMYVIAFKFDNIEERYDSISYTYSGSASNRSRFMGVVVDGNTRTSDAR